MGVKLWDIVPEKFVKRVETIKELQELRKDVTPSLALSITSPYIKGTQILKVRVEGNYPKDMIGRPLIVVRHNLGDYSTLSVFGDTTSKRGSKWKLATILLKVKDSSRQEVYAVLQGGDEGRCICILVPDFKTKKKVSKDTLILKEEE